MATSATTHLAARATTHLAASATNYLAARATRIGPLVPHIKATRAKFTGSLGHSATRITYSYSYEITRGEIN